MRRRPCSTPFPYTMLFRSRLLGQGVGVDAEEPDALLDHLLLHLARQLLPDLLGREGRVEQEHRARGGVLEDVDLVDRKSTRLNSSHLGISYAVPCLKKNYG